MPEHSLSNDPVLVREVLQTKPIWVLQFSLNPCLPPQCVIGQEVYGVRYKKYTYSLAGNHSVKHMNLYICCSKMCVDRVLFPEVGLSQNTLIFV